MPSPDKRQFGKPVREPGIVKPRPIGNVTEKERERLTSHRSEYPVIAFVWRFVTIARGLLIITAVTGISTLMNYIRTGYLRAKEAVILTDGKTITIADEYINILAGWAVMVGLTGIAWIVLRIDNDFDRLQSQCVERGMACERVLGIENGVFHRAESHKQYLQSPFYLARYVLMIVWAGWVYFIYSISR